MKLENEFSNSHKLLGFRTNKLYKKIISITYLFLVSVFSAGMIVMIESRLDALVAAEFTISSFVPYIFLSDFKLRDKLPLFKKHKAGYSVLGMICVYILIGTFFTLINPDFYR